MEVNGTELLLKMTLEMEKNLQRKKNALRVCEALNITSLVCPYWMQAVTASLFYVPKLDAILHISLRSPLHSQRLVKKAEEAVIKHKYVSDLTVRKRKLGFLICSTSALFSSAHAVLHLRIIEAPSLVYFTPYQRRRIPYYKRIGF